jgi:ferritin-like metal-binding protein YciE
MGSGKEEPTGNFLREDITIDFRKFFISKLREIYGSEIALAEALPNLSKNVFSEQLREALNDQLNLTKVHINRIEKIFELLELNVDFNTCLAMVGLIEEAGDVVSDYDQDFIRDAGIILAGQRIVHYEIATYGTMVCFAKIMGENEVAEILSQSLADEKLTDKTLTALSDAFVNHQAIIVNHNETEVSHPNIDHVNSWNSGVI